MVRTVRALISTRGSWLSACIAAAPLFAASEPAAARGGRCPPGMAVVGGSFCMDRWEASLDVVDANDRVVRRHSPYHTPRPDVRVVARSRAGVVPQGYVSQQQAAAACAAAGKRLCSDREWLAACRGENARQYPYGNELIPGRCNDSGVSGLRVLHGKDESAFGFEPMNDPRLNQMPGTVARTGQFRSCRTPGGIHDLVGNLHEWTAAKNGTFRGGYYLDTRINGEGCEYVTTAHVPSYHDYSIGFRCCADINGERRANPKEASASRADPRRETTARRVRVEPGDTLSEIAQEYGTTVRDICRLNRISAKAPIRPGQELLIPPR